MYDAISFNVSKEAEQLKGFRIQLNFSVIHNIYMLCFSEGYLKHVFEGQKTDHNAMNLKRLQNM